MAVITFEIEVNGTTRLCSGSGGTKGKILSDYAPTLKLAGGKIKESTIKEHATEADATNYVGEYRVKLGKSETPDDAELIENRDAVFGTPPVVESHE